MSGRHNGLWYRKRQGPHALQSFIRHVLVQSYDPRDLLKEAQVQNHVANSSHNLMPSLNTTLTNCIKKATLYIGCS